MCVAGNPNRWTALSVDNSYRFAFVCGKMWSAKALQCWTKTWLVGVFQWGSQRCAEFKFWILHFLWSIHTHTCACKINYIHTWICSIYANVVASSMYPGIPVSGQSAWVNSLCTSTYQWAEYSSLHICTCIAYTHIYTCTRTHTHTPHTTNERK